MSDYEVLDDQVDNPIQPRAEETRNPLVAVTPPSLPLQSIVETSQFDKEIKNQQADFIKIFLKYVIQYKNKLLFNETAEYKKAIYDKLNSENVEVIDDDSRIFNDISNEDTIITAINSYINLNEQEDSVKYLKIFNIIKANYSEIDVIKDTLTGYTNFLLRKCAFNYNVITFMLKNTLVKIINEIGACDAGIFGMFTPRVIKNMFGTVLRNKSLENKLNPDEKIDDEIFDRIGQAQPQQKEILLRRLFKSKEEKEKEEAIVMIKISMVNMARQQFIDLAEKYNNTSILTHFNTDLSTSLESFYLNTTTQTVVNIFAQTMISVIPAIGAAAVISNPLLALLIPLTAFIISMATKNTFIVKDPNILMMNKDILETFRIKKNEIQKKLEYTGQEFNIKKCDLTQENELYYYSRFVEVLKVVKHFQEQYDISKNFEKNMYYYINILDVLNNTAEKRIPVVPLEPAASIEMPLNSYRLPDTTSWMDQVNEIKKKDMAGRLYKVLYGGRWYALLEKNAKFLFLNENDELITSKEYLKDLFQKSKRTGYKDDFGYNLINLIIMIQHFLKEIGMECRYQISSNDIIDKILNNKLSNINDFTHWIGDFDRYKDEIKGIVCNESITQKFLNLVPGLGGGKTRKNKNKNKHHSNRKNKNKRYSRRKNKNKRYSKRRTRK
jgi:hypothetical protein